jgi:SAM-dependent methyltransferase
VALTSDVRDTSGVELELFSDARAWKSYFGSVLAPYIRGDVLEVGGGIGETTAVLINHRVRSWTAVEPAEDLFASLATTYASEVFVGRVSPLAPGVEPRAIHGTIAATSAVPAFDTIVYVDVLEHIPDDRRELVEATARLRPGGRIVTLSPAHMSLMSEFDREIGHHRRYDAKMVAGITPPGTELERVVYLDSAGMALSLANRLVMRQKLPTKRQIDMWNRFVVPVSRVLDRITRFRLGKSIVAIWRLAEADAQGDAL